MNIKGKYNNAIVYTEVIEETAIKQIQRLCDQSFTSDSKIRIMPDVHAGIGSTIGTTMTIKDKAVPNLVGVDIGCGMETIKIKNSHLELQRFDKIVYSKIPSGYSVRKTPHKFADQIDLLQLHCLKEMRIDFDKVIRSIGTLGGGNHFIEADIDEEGNIYIVIHSGSRHLGLEVARFYQNKAIDLINKQGKACYNNLIKKYKTEGRQSEIQIAISDLKANISCDTPEDLCYVYGDDFDDYIHDMKIVQQFALINRKAMMYELIKAMNLKVDEEFSTIHNYIDTDNMILRKGAVSAQKGEKLLIPINMKDGSLICLGKGNSDWNYSAPHGAGRLMSRTQARESFSVSEFKKKMSGIYTTSVSRDTIDECPMAYKNIDDIINNISDTVEIKNIIKPIYNFKAGA